MFKAAIFPDDLDQASLAFARIDKGVDLSAAGFKIGEQFAKALIVQINRKPFIGLTDPAIGFTIGMFRQAIARLPRGFDRSGVFEHDKAR